MNNVSLNQIFSATSSVSDPLSQAALYVYAGLPCALQFGGLVHLIVDSAELVRPKDPLQFLLLQYSPAIDANLVFSLDSRVFLTVHRSQISVRTDAVQQRIIDLRAREFLIASLSVLQNEAVSSNVFVRLLNQVPLEEVRR